MRCKAQDNLHVESEWRKWKGRQMPSAVCALSAGVYLKMELCTQNKLWMRQIIHAGTDYWGSGCRVRAVFVFILQLSFLESISFEMRRRFALIKQTHQTRQYSIGRRRFCFCSPALRQNFFKRIFRGGLWKPAEHGNSFSLWCFKLLGLVQK